MIALPLSLVLAAAVTQNRPVESFHSVSLSGGLHVTVHKGKAPALTLSGESREVEKIETFVKGGQLTVRPKNEVERSDESVKVDLTVTTLDGLEASGGVTVVGEGLASQKCALELSGGVEVDLQGLSCDALNVEASGGARLKLAGAAKTLGLDLSGGVQLETRAMSVSDAKIKASGGVSGRVAVADTLETDLSGGVSLKVKGHPRFSRNDSDISASLRFE
ncbi:MAG: DUF2807 domain-containing protein [Archangiaceae bacterium]|nr:DUF2807 domain-containing protein [Archangiaceae bacterium]